MDRQVVPLVPLLHAIPLPLFVAGCVVLSAYLLRIFKPDRGDNSRGLPYPPGPKPLPLIGNLHQVSTAEPWLSYTAWKKKYGDILHVRLLGQHFIILNSEKIARVLLDQRSAVYSDRLVVRAYSILGIDYSTTLLPYGDKWRLHRKIFQHAFRPESEARNRDMYLKKVHTLLTNLLDAPAEFETHIKNYVASNIMAIAYGYETRARNDPMVETIMSLVDPLAKLFHPERCAIISAFPFLEKLPKWLPGSELWRDISHIRKASARVLDDPFNWVKDQMTAGHAPPSLVADCLGKLDPKDDDFKEQEHAIKATAATVFAAGFETTSSVLHTFVLAMVLYPEVQTKAQAEIDSVLVGSGRLPSFDDRESLPYVDAILRELVRWRPAVPLGVPHATSTDDVYEGYFIPKGSLILINVWAIGRDEDSFTDVDAFVPERYLTEQGTLDPKTCPPLSAHPIFGLGRRICPGRFSSEASLWITIASVLAAFRITKTKDANGKEVDVQKRFTTGFSMRPVGFECSFVSRSVDREQAIRKPVH